MIEVFIPFWGKPELLYDAVQSVLAQSDPDWRLRVVDDCYPDEGVGDYFATLDDARVTYLRNETNLGITDNYRRCLELASAEWMVFMGCDDVMLPDYLRTVRAAIDRADRHVDVVQPGVRVIDEAGRPARPLVDRVKRHLFAPRLDGPVTLSGEDLAVSLLRGNWTYWPSLAFRTATVRKHTFVDGFPLIQDLALLVDLALAGSHLVALPDEVFAYRRHLASASSATVSDGRRFRGEKEYFRLAAARCDERGWHRAARAARVHLASRLYAASEVPGALRAGAWTSAGVLTGHALGRP